MIENLPFLLVVKQSRVLQFDAQVLDKVYPIFLGNCFGLIIDYTKL